jgi:hypothetical protein
MLRSILIALVLVGMSMTAGPAAADDWSAGEPSATIEYSGWTIGAGIGFSQVHGLLHHDGVSYPITIHGTQLVDLGAAKISGDGQVYGLKDPTDIAGKYHGTSLAGTFAVGARGGRFQSPRGIYIETQSVTYGGGLTVGATPIRIVLD